MISEDPENSQIQTFWGSVPDPVGEAYSVPRPIAGIEGVGQLPPSPRTPPPFSVLRVSSGIHTARLGAVPLSLCLYSYMQIKLRKFRKWRTTTMHRLMRTGVYFARFMCWLKANKFIIFISGV